ncbi:putative reverse transcriptase domain-containing protein [Tanacetum coccineum]
MLSRISFSFLYGRHFDVLYYLGHMFRPLDFFYVIHVDLIIGSRCLIPAFHLVLLGRYKNTGKAYAAGHGEKKYYGGSKPLCPKCNYHHDGPCPPKCHRCNIVGHLVRNCRRPTNDNTTNNQRGTGTSQKIICYECGNQGHYKRDCPERKNQSHKNQIEGTRAHGVVHTLRGGETDQGPNNIKDGIEA